MSDRLVRKRAPHVKRMPPRTASDSLQQIFNLMLDRNIRVEEMGHRMARHPQRLSEWRRGLVEPGVMAVEEMAAHLNCRLVLVPRDAEKSDG